MKPSGWRTLEQSLSRWRPHRQALSLVIDGTIVWLAWQATHLFRMGFDRWLSARPAYDPLVAIAVVAVYLILFRAMRLNTAVWRLTSFVDIQRLSLACLSAGLLCAVLISPVLQLSKVPRAVLALHPFVSLMGVCMARLLYRMLIEHLQARLHGPRESLRPALVLGAGEAAKRLIAGVQGQGWAILGLLDDDPAKRGASVAGVTVLGPLSQMASCAQALGATHLILALPSLRGPERRRVIEAAVATGLNLLTVPSADELRRGDLDIRVREIEPAELLGREPIEMDTAAMAQEVRGRVVLITGAGGSIGAELCLQVALCEPARLVLVDHAEFALYRIHQRLLAEHPGTKLTACLVDVKDDEAVQAVLHEHRPDMVLHAAAYKHVPLVEEGNAWAALRNNTIGTWVTARAAGRAGVRRFVMISTDKAVNPSNVMGATKRAAERLLASLVGEYPGTAFIAVRFGNVLGSRGSVIPLFKQQIAAGGPITVTHPDIIRYFMTIPEACRLVLLAAAVGQSGHVMVLDMGEPVKIVDLAKAMIRLSGHREQDIPIVFTGLRPGEKLYEELLASEDTTVPTSWPHLRLAVINSACEFEDARRWVDQSPHHSSGHSRAELEASVRDHLRRLVPEFCELESVD